MANEFELLWELLRADSPSGDEDVLADWLAETLTRTLPDARMERVGDCLIARRGVPKVAVFAHLDTTGFTLGYDKSLIPIGGPAAKPSDLLKPVGSAFGGNKVGARGSLVGSTDELPGSRWVYAAEARQEGEEIVGPYLDNRAGVWAAVRTLSECENVAVAFTSGEEHSGKGAILCARRLFEQDAITQALIADLTWDTKHVHSGQGVAISLRDRSVPRRRYLERVLALAQASGLLFQREIESAGGSDGAWIDRSGAPLDWVFVGAPEQHPHTAAERVSVQDLRGMVAMLVFLVNGLTGNSQ